MYNAAYWVEKLKMQAHPEGGYFAETYRASESISATALPKRFGGDRNFSTGIYFLLESHHFSTFHRIQSDEMWHFYTGCPLEIYWIDQNGALYLTKLGNNPQNDEVFQAVIPAGVWFGSRPMQANSYSLVGCTVAPGFDFADFELADRNALLEQYPEHKEIIQNLTH